MKYALRTIIPLFLLVVLWGCSDSPTDSDSCPKLDSAAYETEIINSLGDFPNARGVFFLNENKGVVVTYYGRLGVTVDGGSTWEPRDSLTDKPLQSVYFVNDDVGYVVGGAYQDGVVLKTIDGGASCNVSTVRMSVHCGTHTDARLVHVFSVTSKFRSTLGECPAR